MNSIDKALLPELPEAPWAERARFFMDMKRPLAEGLHKEAGAPIKSSLVAGGLGALISGSGAYTAARITGADRRNALQRELDNEVASGNLGIAHNGRRSFADWVGEHPWAVAAIGGALGGAVSGGLRYNRMRKLFNKGVDASVIPKGTVEGLALPVAPAEVAKVSALSSYFEDSAREDANAEQADAEWDKLAHVVDSMSYDGLAELDVLLESGLVSREDLASLVKEAGWGRKLWGNFLDGFGANGNRYGNRILASEGSELAAQRLSPLINKNLDKANKLTSQIASAEADIARLKDNPAALGRIEDLTNKAAKLRKKQVGLAETARNDMNLQAIPSGKTAPSATQKASADALIPKVDNSTPIATTPIAKADDAPFLDKAKTHFKTNWPWYAAGVGGAYLGSKLMKPQEDPAADGYEVQSAAGAAKLEVRFQMGLISQEEYEKEAGMLGKAVDWGAKKLFGLGVRGGGVVRRAAAAGDDVARGVAGTRAVGAVADAQKALASVSAAKKELRRLKGLNSPYAASRIKDQEKLIASLEKKVPSLADDAEKYRSAQLVAGRADDPFTVAGNSRNKGLAAQAAEDRSAKAAELARRAKGTGATARGSAKNQLKNENLVADEELKLNRMSKDVAEAKIPARDALAVDTNPAFRSLKRQEEFANRAAESKLDAARLAARQEKQLEHAARIKQAPVQAKQVPVYSINDEIAAIRSRVPGPVAKPTATPMPSVKPAASAPAAPAAKPTAPEAPEAPDAPSASATEGGVTRKKEYRPIGFWEGFGSTAGAGFQHPIKSVSRVVNQSDHAGFQAFKEKNPWGAAGVTAGRLAAPTVYGAGGLYTAGKVFGAGSDD